MQKKEKDRSIYVDDFVENFSKLEEFMLSGEEIDFNLAEVLRNLLAEKRIESRCVSGLKKDEETGEIVSHSWNQVKLNGTWFNCDISIDKDFLVQELAAPMFLKSNQEFSNYIDYPLNIKPQIEMETCSLDNKYQEVLFNKYREKIINEIFPESNGKKQKKESLTKKILRMFQPTKGSQPSEQ